MTTRHKKDNNSIACLGECMLELSPKTTGDYCLTYGGDTLNTAVYLARAGSTVSFVTGMGDDAFSNKMRNSWQEEGVDITNVHLVPNKLPGLYAIETNQHGERSFYYWRSDSAARHLFHDATHYLTSLSHFQYLYLTGITLSLFSDETFSELISYLESHRQHGGRIAFDLNYRPKNWKDSSHAISRINALLSLTDIALPSYDDELLLTKEKRIEGCLSRYQKAGVREVVLKNGTDGCYTLYEDEVTHYPLEHIIKPVDTTAAGDSFNAGYLAARMRGVEVERAVRAGQAYAAVVIQHPGAIVDAELFASSLQ